MSESESKELPKFDSVGELVDFLDQTDLGDYLHSMPEVHFEVDIVSRKRYIAVDEDIAKRISELSRDEHVSSGAIVNSWLREKLSDRAQRS